VLITLPQVETKAATPSNVIAPVDLSFAEFLLNGGNFDLGVREALRLYSKCLPLFNAIDTRAEAFSDIPLKIWDKAAQDFLSGHKALDLMAEPNAAQSYDEFAYELLSFSDATGNAFMVASGRVERPPLEISNVPPWMITFGTGSRFGILHMPETVQVSMQHGTEFFEGVEESGRIRYFNRDRDKELWHIRSFNPFRSGGNFWGMSRARAAWLEIQQYISGNNNNLSQLKRGTRLSMAWVNNRDVELTENQWARMQEEAQKYKGDTNAGGTPILDGMDVKTIQQTNRDMEYAELDNATLKKISLAYKIPLAMVVDKATTFNNLATSNIQLYDRAILPATGRAYSELTRFILSRYDNSENLRFWYNDLDIEALRQRALENAMKRSKIGVNTDNEIRSDLGDEAVEGGDVLYKANTMIPVGQDLVTDDNLDKPAATKSRFIEIMRKQAPGVSEEELERMARERGLK
jgi:HK97 family phage portal protein